MTESPLGLFLEQGLERYSVKPDSSGEYPRLYRELLFAAPYRLHLSKQMRLLDLGCGVSATTTRDPLEQEHTPFFCDAFARVGWSVTGVDASVHSNRVDGVELLWTFVQGDITRDDFMRTFADADFDLVHSRFLLSLSLPKTVSPSLQLQSGLFPYRLRTSDELKVHPEYRGFLDRSFAHVLRILRPSGVFLLNDDYLFQKKGDQLVCRHGAGGISIVPQGVQLS